MSGTSARIVELICEVMKMANNTSNEEYLIGVFGAMCDYMVENGRCDVFCPFANTKDQFDECEPWREITDIRMSSE